MKLPQSILFAAVFISLALTAQAEMIIAQGKSAISNGDLTRARQEAIDDAARTALMQAGFDLSSSTDVVNVVEVNDRIQVKTHGQIHSMNVIKETRAQNTYTVTVKADVEQANAHCPSQRYSKSLLVTAFANAARDSQRVGQLYDTQTELSRTLAERLYPQYNLEIQAQPELTLASENRLLHNDYEVFNAVQLVASQYQTQYVVTGIIEDMSMASADYYRQNALGRGTNRVTSTLKSWVGAERDDLRERHFRFRLMLHDGVTGTRIFDQTYATRGLWELDYAAQTNFASPAFWDTDYGQQVSQLVDSAVSDISEKALCQPFMAPLKVASGDQSVYVLAGANSGVNVGDTFEVYAEGQAPFTNIEHFGTMALAPVSYKKLDVTQAKLQITQTYPGYSVGKFDAPLHPNLRYMAVAH
ncbi:flagellar assembly protein T N-terminal domain-containing protein [Gilvimarinus xylanilyticus]|uniref:Flagellar assembly protein T N-terminal domain-containing protein n=1 Tax=Gilvimarinus xylanilyticus TaxID=2944139 RepID=A0A9X2I4H8_9GAMM|nr:flagellar assembly protein T N-terminal domain-containing protein [Gilvimarinus xylanilyticus]MCP8899871.1 flagellar assembly protein T N-terminal domain-containing protein [Gilvimarinus xylanilyticus]